MVKYLMKVLSTDQILIWDLNTVVKLHLICLAGVELYTFYLLFQHEDPMVRYDLEK